MTTYILSQEPPIKRKGKKPEPGRIILDDAAHGSVIGIIEADAVVRVLQTPEGPVEKILKSAWRVAREKVDESKFHRIENLGWFRCENDDQTEAA